MGCYSLNEIEVSARKAARGGGMSWGLAEEAGKATRWLAARGLQNVRLLLTLLRQNDDRSHEALCPESLDGIWKSADGTLCPIVVGSALNDMADALISGREITIRNVSCPALILPILGRAAKALGCGFTVYWQDTRITLSPEALYLQTDQPQALEREQAQDITVTGHPGSDISPAGDKVNRIVQGVFADDRDWAELQAFAARTYVPATAESRLRGAGAGLNDND